MQAHRNVLDAWRKHLSLDDARRIMEIVAAFGLDMYSFEARSEGLAKRVPTASDADVARTCNGSRLTVDIAVESASSLPAEPVVAVVEELCANLMQFERYIDALKRTLFWISDGSQWQMHDWDWLWPRHDPFVVQDTGWRQVRGKQLAIDAEVSAAIDDAYARLRQIPPRLDSFVVEWDGEQNTFLRYMHGKLTESAREASRYVEKAVDSLRPLAPCVTTSP